MKTLKEIVFSIIEFCSGFQVTDDNPLDPELIAKKVHDVRAALIKQEYQENREGKINEQYYQYLILPIKETNIAKEINQFHVTFPTLLMGIGWDNIKYLGGVSMHDKYNRRAMDGYFSSEGRYYGRTLVDYTILEARKALIRNEKIAEKVALLAIFANPTEAFESDGWDEVYPCSDPFKLEMIVKQDIMAGLGIKPDEKNDARHNQDELTAR